LFDVFRAPDASAEFRSAALLPLVAFLVTQGYHTVYPLLARVPPALFWSVAFVAIAGAVAGMLRIGVLLRRHRHELDARAVAWLLAAALTTLVCAFVAVSFTAPWAL
jgi:hypothetical protein